MLTAQAVAMVVVWMALVSWGSHLASRHGLVWDGSGMGLGDARALMAELPADTHVVVVGDAPVERILTPLGRETSRMTVTVLDAGILTTHPQARMAGLRAGDVQVSWSDSWLVLRDADLRTVLWALALVTSPYRPQTGQVSPASYLPLDVAPVETRSAAVVRAEAVVWAVSGLLLPVALCGLGLTLRLWRRGR